jgi:hypothetical protein
VISLLSSLISLQNRQKCRFEPTLKKRSRSKALGLKNPYFKRLSAQTKLPENNTKLPDLDKMTKRLEISLPATARGFESHRLRHKLSENLEKDQDYRTIFYVQIKKNEELCLLSNQKRSIADHSAVSRMIITKSK